MPESPSGNAGISGKVKLDTTRVHEAAHMARKQYPLRIDPAIWEAVQRWADDEMRSANGQVEWILRDALKRAGRLPKKEGGAKDDKA